VTKLQHLTRFRMGMAGVAVAAIFATTACPSNIHPTYKGFQGAITKGAACTDLLEMRNRLPKAGDRTKADADLGRIGCTSAESLRTDR
jgi:hypothetical protein